MIKNNLICALVLGGFVVTNITLKGAEPSSIELKDGKENIKLVQTSKQNGEVTDFAISKNGMDLAKPQQDSNIYAYKMFYDAQKYSRNIILTGDRNLWHRNVAHFDSEAAMSGITEETLATSDSVIEYSKNEYGTNLSYFKSKNADEVRNATGFNLIGMNKEQVKAALGQFQDSSYNEESFLVYGFYIDGGSFQQAMLSMKNDLVSEVQLIIDGPGECPSIIGERAYYDGKLPEGWYTQGRVHAVDLNIRATPKTGEVVGKIRNDHPQVLFAETRDTGEEYPWLHVLSKNESGNTFDGWVYGKYITPSFKGFEYRRAFKQCYEYFSWLTANHIKISPDSIEKSNPDENGSVFVTKTWGHFGITAVIETQEGGYANLRRCSLGNDKYPFAGIKVGDNASELYKLDEYLKKADFSLAEGSEIGHTATARWIDNQGMTPDGYLHCLEVETINGNIVNILFTR